MGDGSWSKRDLPVTLSDFPVASRSGELWTQGLGGPWSYPTPPPNSLPPPSSCCLSPLPSPALSPIQPAITTLRPVPQRSLTPSLHSNQAEKQGNDGHFQGCRKPNIVQVRSTEALAVRIREGLPEEAVHPRSSYLVGQGAG